MKKELNFKPLKKQRLYEEVAARIKKSIFTGELNPGDPLPSERDLAVMFDVGRPTIREAVRTLSVLGLVQCNGGSKGSVVKSMNVGRYLTAMGDQFAWMIKADTDSFNDMWEARKYIEHGIAHAVARNASDDQMAALDTHIENMEALCHDADRYFKVAIDFHLKLAELSGNKIFFMMWRLFYDICIKEYPQLTGMYPTQVRQLLRANKKMIHAIRSRDPDRIDDAMKEHAREEATPAMDKKSLKLRIR